VRILTLEEILKDVDTYVPNTISTEQKVRWINEIQKQLFRDYPVPDAVYQFETVPGLDYYDLPDDCSTDRITNLVIDEQEYDGLSLDSEETSFYWIPVEGKLFIQPTPQDVMMGFIYYRPKPIELTSANLSAIPNFPEDYHELLVFGCAARVAKAYQDVDLANNMVSDFNYLADKAKKELRKTKNKTVRIVQDWR
jgi:hypothetical protein